MSTLASSRLRQVSVVCKDVARARDFYKDTLGLPHLFDAGPTLSFFDCGGVRLMLSVEAPDVQGTSQLYYSVANIDNAKSELESRGVVFLRDPHLIARMPDHDLWLAELRDSEGNVLALMEERGR